MAAMQVSRARRAGDPIRLALVGIALAQVAVVACAGTSQQAQVRARATATPPPRATPSPSPVPYPTQVPPLYGFPKQWQVARSAPHVSAWQLGSGFAFAPSAPQVGYICAVATGGGSGPAFYATRDGGRTWSPARATPFQSSEQCGVYVDPLDPNDILLAQDKLWRSQDGGATWHQLAAITVPGWSISVLNLAVVGLRLVAAVAINGEGTLDNNRYVSDDGGRFVAPARGESPSAS